MFNQVFQQFNRFWSQQSGAQRLVFVLIVALALILIPLFFVWASTPTYEIAFSGLTEEDAGQIVEQLNANNIPYKLRGVGTILVPSNQVYEVRLMMARQGLPSSGNVGFEIFSGNTLGMTEFSQRVNYQRAIEGELERTIGSLKAVQAVRVHLVIPEKTLLSSDQNPATASVTIMEKPGMSLDAAQVRAITHLVASSVEGLRPENVVVVDVHGNMLASGEGAEGGSLTAQADTRRSAELAVAHQVESKVQEILDKALGPNKSVVQASVVLDWTQRETTRQTFDPTQAVVRSEQNIQEVYTTTNGSIEGVPGATTNLPPGGEAALTGGGGVTYNRSESVVNYEITQIQTHEIESPGEIQRISLSVLVDGITDTQQLETLQSVIAAAAGIDQQRGDTIAVQALAFDRTYIETQTAEMQAAERQSLYLRIGEIAAAVILLALILWYVMRVLKNLKLATSEAWVPVMKPVSEMALPAGMGQVPSYSIGVDQLGMGSEGAPQSIPAASTPQGLPFETPPPERKMPKIELPTLSPEYEQLQRTLDEVAESDPASIAEAIQLWLAEDERRNG
ncbi:MAG: flagellar M-ring protein FliF [Anaerolineae bacterium]|jgi:flagellar M-ring protein FliF|nr:MAG: flagellar M-ring protein FliF [Anaerolineae bacterium]